jgi:hypothetical protein
MLNICGIRFLLKLCLFGICFVNVPFFQCFILSIQLSVSGRDNFYILLNYVIWSQYIGSK